MSRSDVEEYKARRAAEKRRARQLREAQQRVACDYCFATVEEIAGEQARLKAERAERQARRQAA